MELTALYIVCFMNVVSMAFVGVVIWFTRRTDAGRVIDRLVEHNERISHLLLQNTDIGIQAVHTQLVHDENVKRIEIEEQLAAVREGPVVDVDSRPGALDGACGLTGVEV